MRILICIPCLLTGGTEVQTFSLAKALLAGAHKVALACYFEHDSGMVRQFQDAGVKVYLLSPDGSRPAGTISTTRFLWNGLKKIIREEEPHVAHVQYMAPGALPILTLRALGIKKIIATAHTSADIYSNNGLRIIRFLTRHVLSGFQCITERAESSFFGTSRLFDGSPSPHFTIHNTLPDHITIRTESRPPLRDSDPLTIGVVSRLEKIKGMDLVIPAFAEIAKKHPNIHLLIVGDGSLHEHMKIQAKQAHISDSAPTSNKANPSDRIEFTGRLSPGELQAQYDRIDILLMPSRSEGFGLTALEGMARGCVPVVADTGGLPEVVRDNIDGLLNIPGSTEDIINKITLLLDNPDVINRFSASSVKRARDFSPDNYKRQINLLYKK
ncbi:MAG: glycosyltransferase family 4 protein [Muribaculaceae bacterium]|nr:glycosyltransferase family 4 protein [Muribaculaceae bacterium]